MYFAFSDDEEVMGDEEDEEGEEDEEVEDVEGEDDEGMWSCIGSDVWDSTKRWLQPPQICCLVSVRNLKKYLLKWGLCGVSEMQVFLGIKMYFSCPHTRIKLFYSGAEGEEGEGGEAAEGGDGE